jgi:ankyrin repeat domain-containing protein 50
MYWRRSEADKAHPDTCNWILEHKSYTQWLHEKRGLLWIKGKPGAGKSTLLAYIFRIFQENSSAQADLSLEFFFHGRGTALQKSSIGMYRSLLHQLYVMDKPSRDPIRKAFQDKRIFGEPGLGWEWQLSELQDLFLTLLLTAAKARRVYIFIDALDEAGSEARDLVGYFHIMNDKLNATGSTAAICISCRHYPVTAIIPGLDVVVEENNHDDIALYVQARLRANIRENQNEIDSKGWSRMEKQIVDDASGVFQWARLVITMVLEHYEEGESWNEIHLKLSKVPRELGAVYEHILSNIIKPERRKKTLQLMQWVFLAERPLTLEELRAAMAFDDTHISSTVQSYKDAEPFLEMYSGIHKLVNSLSGGLAEVKQYDQGNIVQFIHQSVNDFLLSTGLEFLVSKTTEIPPDQSAHEIVRMPTNIIIGQAQDRLSRSCVNYLRLVEVNWRKIVPGIGPKQFGYPFIEYATKYWLVHAKKAEQNEMSQEYLVEHFGPTGQLLEKFLKASEIISVSPLRFEKYGVTFLHLASGSDLRNVVQVLLQKDVFVDVEDDFGERPLHYASREGNKEVVEILLKAGAVPEPKSGHTTPIEYAAVRGHREIVEILLQNGSSSRNALQAAAKAGISSLVKLLLQSGADINASDENHGNALQAAAEKGHEHVVQLLIESGAEINLQGGEYGTALQAAAFHGYESIVQLLLDNGANVHLQGGCWGNALQGAIQGGNRAVIETILDKGPDVNAEGGFYGTPLQAAAQEGDLAVFKLLLDKGASVNVDAGLHGNPLQAACERGRLACAKMLVKRGADVNARGGFHGNALQAAGYSGNAELIVFLLENGAQINTLGSHGSVLRAAAWRGGCSLIDLLLQHGAEIDAGNPRHDTALQAAAAKGHVDATELLLERGANANRRGGRFGSVIQAAAMAGSSSPDRSTTASLLAHGADVNIQGGKYPNALQAAIAEGDIHIVNLLLRHGALFDPQDDEFSRALIAALEDPDCSVEDMLQERGHTVRPPKYLIK